MFVILYALVCYSDAVLQFTETDYSSPENLLFIRPVVQLLTEIATDLTVQVVPISIGEAMDRNLTSLLSIEPFNPREPNIATRKLRSRLLSSAK